MAAMLFVSRKDVCRVLSYRVELKMLCGQYGSVKHLLLTAVNEPRSLENECDLEWISCYERSTPVHDAAMS